MTPEGHVAALFRLAPGRKPTPDGGRQSRFNTRGFVLIDPVGVSHPAPFARVAPDRLIWTDAALFREEEDDPAALLAQALAALLVHRKPIIGEHLLRPARRSAR